MLENKGRGAFKPPCDIMAAEDRFIILIEIAAMQANDFKLSLMNRKLVVSGARSLTAAARQLSYHQVEIETGQFRLEYTLPRPVDDAQVRAHYENGILQIELPYQRRQTVQVAPANKNRKGSCT